MIPQFHDVSLALEFSLGARVKVAYHTNVIRMREAEEDRVGDWQDALRSFDLAPALRGQDDLDGLIAFFRSRLGPTFAFKMRDPTDFAVVGTLCGTGDGTSRAFQLCKSYTTGLDGDTGETLRPIVLPDLPLLMYVHGLEVSAALYTVDATQGLVTFTTPPALGAPVTWSGTFQVPVRFVTTTLPVSFAMLERFDTQIVLQEERVAPSSVMRPDSEPADFVEVVFPPTLSERSESGPQYDTITITGGSGVETRIGQFATPKIAFQVDQAVQDVSDMTVLLHFFHARRGRLGGFLAMDETDYRATQELFAVGDGATQTFQLSKTYQTGGYSQVRLIVRPQLPVTIYVGGLVATAVSVGATGSVTIPAVAPAPGVELRWSGSFYVPVRFDTDELDMSLDGPDVRSWSQIGLLEIPTSLTPVVITNVA